MNVTFELKSQKGGARQIDIDKIGELRWVDYQKNTKPGDKIKYGKVLEFEGEFGQPYLKNKQVVGEVVKHKLAKKIIIFKYKPKKRYKVKKGHRQQYTLIKIIGVENIQ